MSTSVARQICLLRARLGAANALLVTAVGGYRITVAHAAARIGEGHTGVARTV